jgi:tetratricopeptide (TPR) repeat protein
MKTMLFVSAALLAVACNKKTDKPDPGATTEAKTVETKAKEPAPPPPPAAKDVSVTSKSPDAITAFQKGRDLVDNARGAEAIEHLKKAVELDPEFAQAHAYLGMLSPGPAGADELAKAVTLAAKLPEDEKTLITAQKAFRDGDDKQGLAGFAKVSELSPGAWRPEIVLGNIANETGDHVGAIKRFEHVLSVKPDLALAHNGLAYAHAALREWEPAITEAKKQVELLPKEPNPQDTLGEILLWSSKFDESEKAFQAAIALEPKFTLSWQGIALARAYRGDYKGANEAFEKQKAGLAPGEKFEAMLGMAWLAMAQDKLTDGLAIVDAVDKDAEAKKLPIYAFAALDRAFMHMMAGKPADASTWFATALTRADALSGDGKNMLLRNHALGVLRLAAMAGKPAADSDKLLARFDDEAKAAPDNIQRHQMAAWAHGLAAWAKTGPKDAVAELSKCDPEMVGCRFDLVLAQRKSGDTAGADAIEKVLKETPRREAVGVYLLTHLGKK